MALFTSLLKTFGLKALYGLAGLIAAWLLFSLSNFQIPPETNPIVAWIWHNVIVAGLVGLAAVLKRIGQTVALKATGNWDPSKVGK